MADETKPTDPVPTPPPATAGGGEWDWYNTMPKPIRHSVTAAVAVLCSVLVVWVSGLAKLNLKDIKDAVKEAKEQDKAEQSATAAQFTGESSPPAPAFAFGWVNDPDARDASVARFNPVAFADTPAGKVARGEVPDTFLWRAVRKAAGRGELDDWYPNVNQLTVGDCVGCGFKHGADVCQGVQVARDGGEFKPLSVEVIYGLSRVDIGKGQLGGEDGSIGAWAAEAVRTIGVAAMQKYPSDDLTAFDTLKARRYGSRGVPEDIKAAAREHPVKATAVVKSWADVQRAVGQGYPVPVCSDVGFENPDGSPGTRDKDGFCKARGNWPHCMVFIAVRGGARPGAFCLNSWGDSAHRGPTWPADAPKAGFWVDAATVDRMVRQGDSYSLSDLDGFKARKLDWVVDARPAKPNARDPLGVFALAW